MFYNDLGIRIRSNNGIPEWATRGADTWSPFSSSFSKDITIKISDTVKTEQISYAVSTATINFNAVFTLTVKNNTITITQKSNNSKLTAKAEQMTWNGSQWVVQYSGSVPKSISATVK